MWKLQQECEEKKKKKTPQGKEKYMKEETVLAHKLLTIAVSPPWKACFS